jgi:hypothetical protein
MLSLLLPDYIIVSANQGTGGKHCLLAWSTSNDFFQHQPVLKAEFP